MAHQSEAECLLQTGALYGKRMLLTQNEADPIFAGFKPGAFSLYFGDAPIFHFDREGRWQRAYCEGLHYLKALDTTVQTIDRVREGTNLVLKRKTLSPIEAVTFDNRVRHTALSLISSLDEGHYVSVAPPDKARPLAFEELRAFLAKVERWDEPAWNIYRDAYDQTYGPFPFLPPDCTNPLVLQATIGHERGIAFGRRTPGSHIVRSPDEFDAHACAVDSLLGLRVTQCKAVFLGGSDLLLRPESDVMSYLETILRVFPVDTTSGPRHPDATELEQLRLAGIHTLLDRFDDALPDTDTLRRYRELGLVRINLGVESGDPLVRASFGKTWQNRSLASFVNALKAAGISVGVVTLIGAGPCFK